MMKKTLRLLGAAALALGLSGCGGGGGGSAGGPAAPSTGGGGSGAPGPSARQPASGAGAGGVSVTVSRGSGAPSFAFSQGGAAWGQAASAWEETGQDNHGHATAGGFNIASWPGETRRSGSRARVAAHTNIGQAMNGEEDADYLVFGYWNDPGDTDEIAPFYWGSQPFTGSLPATGSASYSGAAAGTYAPVLGFGGLTASNGYFTANVSLTANFGNAPTVSGRVNGFKVYPYTAGRSDPPDLLPALSTWSITLESAPVSGSGFSGAATGSTTKAGTTTTNSGGTWSGSFFGPSGAAPTGATGEFEADLDGFKDSRLNGPRNKFAVKGAFAAD